MIEQNDWRLQGQEEYLNNITLYHKKYTRYSEEWDHDHCEFCSDTLSEYEGDLHIGYAKNVIMILKKCLVGKLLKKLPMKIVLNDR